MTSSSAGSSSPNRQTPGYGLKQTSLGFTGNPRGKQNTCLRMDGILPHQVEDGEYIDFQWGRELDVSDTGCRSYESFMYDDVQYSKFDCVYVWPADQPEPEIGVIVNMWESSTSKKRVKIVWFFRARDIRNFIGNKKVLKNELFLASGEGKGLSNINSPLAIAGKCNVVCAIKNMNNPQPSSVELRMADFIFYRTFNVGTYVLSNQFPDKIAGFRVNVFFNKKKYPRPVKTFDQNLNEISKKRISSPKLILHDQSGNGVTDWKSNTSEQPLKKRKLEINHSSLEISSSLSPSDATFVSQHTGFSEGVVEMECNNQVFEASKRSNLDTRRWFKQLPWEERMKDANNQGSLVFLENLDPTYTSSEVEDIVRHALNEKVHARVLEHNSFSMPHNGQAFVIFKSKVAAGIAIDRLKRKCLMLPNGRPLIAYKRTPTEPDKAAKLVGHLEVNQSRIAKRKDMREAVATSHCSQPNNMEYDLALKWCRLQEQTAAWWTALHQKQLSEIKNLTSTLKRT